MPTDIAEKIPHRSPAAMVTYLCGVDPRKMPRPAYLLAENIASFSEQPGPVLAAFGAWLQGGADPGELPFHPTRILMQDTAGVAALADLAALRDSASRAGLAPEGVDSALPIDLVIDHSVHVEHAGTADALARNMATEMKRNVERYGFFKWAESTFVNLRVIPPGQGICHQINLEQLAQIAVTGPRGMAVNGSVIGTDSHTTMINALGILGWGVGGMEAQVAALGQPLALAAQRMTRVELTGRRQPGVAAADLALGVTQALRAAGVVSEFIEFGGQALSELSLPDRAAIANMAPEYGAFCGLFPVDQATLDYLAQMGRSPEELARHEAYARETGLWRDDHEHRLWQRQISINLSEFGLSMAGPSRPHDRHALADIPEILEVTGTAHHPVVIAAITSCTNTANPASMIAAGLVARAARARGLTVPGHVKTSLAPGSRRIAALLRAGGLQADLDALGFQVVGFGCTTCVGNSGKLLPAAKALRATGAELCAVLSGNRNFEGRIHPEIKSNWLASPALVVVAALAGRLENRLDRGAVTIAPDGKRVTLADLWPSDAQIDEVLRKAEIGLTRDTELMAETGWQAITAPTEPLYPWRKESLFLQPPPFFDEAPLPLLDLHDSRILLALGDGVTTDHISPVGRIDPQSPAGRMICSSPGATAPGSYGAYRANHEVMARGTFAHPLLSNRLAPGQGPRTEVERLGTVDIFDASVHYRAQGVATVVLAGERYGMGSARDWAAKGTRMLGVRAVLASGFERIHRTNLVAAGVLPVEVPDDIASKAGVNAGTVVCIRGLANMNRLHARVTVTLTTPGEAPIEREGLCRIDTPTELDWIRAGGVFSLARNRISATG
ncbi:MAG: aconitate hydratase AcnA [Pararhodobacter sp.]|nr:aconitate hydratase AcnA [Pararhodobacter sp.]